MLKLLVMLFGIQYNIDLRAMAVLYIGYLQLMHLSCNQRV